MDMSRISLSPDQIGIADRHYAWPQPPPCFSREAPVNGAPPADNAVTTPMVVFGYNDLGMHCMNSDFSEIMVLPPFNKSSRPGGSTRHRTTDHHPAA